MMNAKYTTSFPYMDTTALYMPHKAMEGRHISKQLFVGRVCEWNERVRHVCIFCPACKPSRLGT